jgi:hypothetical protein
MELKRDEVKLMTNNPTVPVSPLGSGRIANDGGATLSLTVSDVIAEKGSDIEAVHFEVTVSLVINGKSRLKAAENDAIDRTDGKVAIEESAAGRK